MSIEQYLISKGFTKSQVCPSGVNRWTYTDRHNINTSSVYASITLTEDGKHTKYGVVLFFGYNPQQFICEKRCFDNASLTNSQINRILNKDRMRNTSKIRVYDCRKIYKSE